MKKLLLLFAACIVSIGMDADEAEYIMRVSLTDGKVDTYVVADHPYVTFLQDVTRIYSNGLLTEYESGKIESYSFVERDVTEIEEVTEQEDNAGITVWFTDGVTVKVRGIAPETAIRVYTVGGQMVTPIVSPQPDGADITFSNQPSGTYIINIGNEKSIKIQKR